MQGEKKIEDKHWKMQSKWCHEAKFLICVNMEFRTLKSHLMPDNFLFVKTKLTEVFHQLPETILRAQWNHTMTDFNLHQIKKLAIVLSLTW